MADSDNMSVRRVKPDNNSKPDETPVDSPEEEITDEIPEDGSDAGSSGNGPTGHRSVGSTVTHWASSVGHGISNGIGSLAGRFGIPKTAMSVILAVCVAGGSAGAATLLSNNNTEEIILRQVDYEDDCADEYNDAVNKAPTSSDLDVDAQKQEVAEKLWAFGKANGMTDEQCAGMLGNFEQECGLDYTEIESVYEIWHTEKPYVMDESSPHKWELAQMPCTAMDKYVPGDMLASYGGSGIDLPAYRYNGDYADDYINNSKFAGHYYPGIGLVQWTGPTAAKLINDAEVLNEQGVKDSENNDIYWWNFEYQCAHMINSEKNSKGISRFQGFLSESGAGDTKKTTANWFGWMEHGVGRPYYGKSYTDRLKYANQWYAKLSSQSSAITKKWSSWVDAVMALAETETGAATGKHAAELDEECDSDEKQENYDNSDIARAAVSYSWPNKDSSYNNGTALYRAVKDAMFPNNRGESMTYRYMSCDRGVSTAVHWANADDNFPIGSTATQYTYMEGQAKSGGLWEEVGMGSTLSAEDYQPGDVLIITPAMRGSDHGHIVLYVSNEIIKEKYPDAPASYECVQASYGSRSPACYDQGKSSTHDSYCVFRYTGNYEGTDGNNYTGNDSGTSQ